MEEGGSGPVPGAWTIRDEVPGDAAAVAAVNTAAFGQADEAEMVRAVREGGDATVSLVAELDDGSGAVVGHILLSPVTVDGASEPAGLGLAPMAVLPGYQRRGIGAQLIAEAVARARQLGYAYLVVLGHPEYYPRFGFVPASRFGLRYGQPVPDEVFMAQELVAGALRHVRGVVSYLPAFAEG